MFCWKSKYVLAKGACELLELTALRSATYGGRNMHGGNRNGVGSFQTVAPSLLQINNSIYSNSMRNFASDPKAAATPSNDSAFAVDSPEKQKQPGATSMAPGEHIQPIRVPNDGHNYVTLLKWLKKNGSFIKREEPLCEIDTPEYTYELRSPFEGYIIMQLVPAGKEKLEPDEVIAKISPNKDDIIATPKTPEVVAPVTPTAAPIAPSTFKLEDWLKSMNEKYVSKEKGYLKKFQDNGYETLDEILMLTEDELVKMDIKPGHAKVIMSHIAAMQPQPAQVQQPQQGATLSEAEPAPKV